MFTLVKRNCSFKYNFPSHLRHTATDIAQDKSRSGNITKYFQDLFNTIIFPCPQTIWGGIKNITGNFDVAFNLYTEKNKI